MIIYIRLYMCHNMPIFLVVHMPIVCPASRRRSSARWAGCHCSAGFPASLRCCAVLRWNLVLPVG